MPEYNKSYIFQLKREDFFQYLKINLRHEINETHLAYPSVDLFQIISKIKFKIRIYPIVIKIAIRKFN